MLDIYAGIKIEDEIIIVEKQNEDHQGFLVAKDNKNQLETALNWARTQVKDTVNEEATEKYRKEYEERYGKQTDWTIYNYKTLDGVVHNYKNGNFKLKLCESASRSWCQGGKLSFWNCEIICPDGKVFLIGINSECLLSLLKNTTFINGECQANLWLGRIKNNVGAFTEDMDEYKQGIKDKEFRELKLSAKYDKIGQLIQTKTEIYCYLGEFYKHFDIYRKSSECYYYYRREDYEKYPKFFVNFLSKPKKYYAYVRITSYSGEQISEQDINNDTLSEYCFCTSKKPGKILDTVYNIDLDKIINNTKEHLNSKTQGRWRTKCIPGGEYYHGKYNASFPEWALLGNMFTKCYSTNKSFDNKDLAEKFKLENVEPMFDLEIDGWFKRNLLHEVL